MSEFDFERLRRWPDVEAENLFASDAADHLILDEAADALKSARPGEVVVLEDHYGALALGAVALHGATGIRVHQDALSGERALARNAADAGLVGTFRLLDLGEELFAGARVVLLQLPRSLSALDELVASVVRYAAPDVRLFAGGRIKHMTTAMNAVLERHFGRLDVSLARQKSRVLVASEPRAVSREPASDWSHGVWPRCEEHPDAGLTVCAHGAAFAGTTIDIGTRYLLEFLDRMNAGRPNSGRPSTGRTNTGRTNTDSGGDGAHVSDDTRADAIDLGCGTGVLAAALALSRPGLRVLATDQSAAAVASARATMAANGVADRVTVVRDDALSSRPDASVGLIMLNPPFHIGASVHAGIALKLFDDAARVLRPGGELWTVWNTHLSYRPVLNRVVGPTHQVGRNAKFTVTVSTRR